MPSSTIVGNAAALVAAFCWAVGSHLFGRIGRRGDVPAASMNLGKCITAMALFWIAGVVINGRIFPSMPLGKAALLFVSGIIGLSLGDGAYFKAILSIGVRRSLLLLSMAPVFTALGGALFLDEALHLRDAAGILAVVVGVAVVVYEQQALRDGSLALEPPKLSAIGLLFALGAAVGQAAGGLMSRLAMADGMSALDSALVRLPGGLLGIVVLAIGTGRLRHTARVLRNPRLFGAIAAASVVGTFIGIWLSQYAISHAASTAIASTLMAMSPVFALPLGYFLNRERISLRAVVGTLSAVGGLSLLTLGRA
ncbi:MAG: DMT family transporter [Minicystis sp.]